MIISLSFIAVNDYFTFFYVKHFELPMCMKCAIQINLPCLALPCLKHSWIIGINCSLNVLYHSAEKPSSPGTLVVLSFDIALLISSVVIF